MQVMSAGTGISHSEYNMEDEETTLFQIWIIPSEPDRKAPSWGARPFPKGDRSGRFVTLASGIDGDEGALPIRTDARVAGATLKAGETAEYRLGGDRYGYLVPAAGSVEVNGVRVRREAAARGDGIVVPHPKIAPVHPVRITVAGEREMMLGVEPAMVGAAEAVERTKVDHRCSPCSAAHRGLAWTQDGCFSWLTK